MFAVVLRKLQISEDHNCQFYSLNFYSLGKVQCYYMQMHFWNCILHFQISFENLLCAWKSWLKNTKTCGCG